MASLHQEKLKNSETVTWRIRFTLAGQRKSIRLGSVPKKLAETVCSQVEGLVNSRVMNVSYSQETAKWLGGIDDELHEKLAKVGLVTARQTVRLADQLERYIQAHSGGKETSTLEKWRFDRDRLIQFFGTNRDIKTVTRSECDQYKTWLYSEKHFADSTVGRAIRNARMFFAAWVRDGILSRNPFDGVKSSNAIDESRNHYIPTETVELAMEYCPDAEWRAIFALARFAGLRPGEIYALKLDAIKWERDIIIVTSPKTKRHVGGGQREIPIFPELRQYLLDVAESAREGAVYVLDRLHERATGKAKTPNLGKIVNDILEKAGIPKWTKPFVSMRGSCETDLARVYPIQVVTAWIGNSPRVAQKHYLRVLPEHFEQAAITSIFSDRNQSTTDSSAMVKQERIAPHFAPPQNLGFQSARSDASPLKSKLISKKNGAKNGAASVGKALQINEAANKKAVNCSLLQSTAFVCEAKTPRVGS
jgi:integrase